MLDTSIAITRRARIMIESDVTKHQVTPGFTSVVTQVISIVYYEYRLTSCLSNVHLVDPPLVKSH